MRKIRTTAVSVILTAVLTLSCSAVCHADDYDLSNMPAKELEALKDSIEEELDTNHKPTSKQKNSVEKATRQYIEEKYGKENVDWSHHGQKYAKEWDFYTLNARVEIIKEDGGETKYDVYSEVIGSDKEYTIVYLQLGNETVLNDRDLITDKRVLKLIESEEAEKAAE